MTSILNHVGAVGIGSVLPGARRSGPHTDYGGLRAWGQCFGNLTWAKFDTDAVCLLSFTYHLCMWGCWALHWEEQVLTCQLHDPSCHQPQAEPWYLSGKWEIDSNPNHTFPAYLSPHNLHPTYNILNVLLPTWWKCLNNCIVGCVA